MLLRGSEVTCFLSLTPCISDALQYFNCHVNEPGEKRKVYP